MTRLTAASLCLLLALSGCTGPVSPPGAPTVLPAEAVALPGLVQRFEVQDVAAEDAVWTASAGGPRVLSQGQEAQLLAPAAPGTYTVTVSSRKDPRRTASATLVVRAVTSEALTLTSTPAEGGVAGLYGAVRFAASPRGEAGATARFSLEPSRSGGSEQGTASQGLSAQGGGTVLEVEVLDGTRGRLTFAGRTLDGDGALTAEEEAALRELASSALFPAVALAPLDLACSEASAQVEPRVMAALLLPWQAVLKYLTAERVAQVEAFASASRCRYFTALSPEPLDSRPAPLLPALSNGRAVPASYGYLPLDAHGALAPVPAVGQGLAAAAADGPLAPAQNEFGPGGSLCRGACGPDCEKRNCGEPKREDRCEQVNGKNTGRKSLWESYTCGEHEGCRVHDACFDECNGTFGVDTWDAAFCMRGCDMQAAQGHGTVQGLEWARGDGPFDREKTYEYEVGERVEDLALCPPAITLIAVPSAGLSPLSTVLRWSGVPQTGGTPRCRLDPGDGSPAYTIDRCTESGEQPHVYRVPADLRRAEGVYTATLQLVGTTATGSAEVQPTWRFEATPASGSPPLDTVFRWEGLPTTEWARALTCTLAFGDGTEALVVQDCARATTATHTYAAAGSYTAELTVRGERTVTRSLVVTVRPEAATDGITVTGAMSGHFPARLSNTEGVHSWDVETLEDSETVVNVHFHFDGRPTPGTYTCDDLLFASWGAASGENNWEAMCRIVHVSSLTVTVTSVEDVPGGWYTIHGRVEAGPTAFNFPSQNPIVITAVF
jgi:PKD repeat protein